MMEDYNGPPTRADLTDLRKKKCYGVDFVTTRISKSGFDV